MAAAAAAALLAVSLGVRPGLVPRLDEESAQPRPPPVDGSTTPRVRELIQDELRSRAPVSESEHAHRESLWGGGANFMHTANRTDAALNGDKWCAWAHSSIDTNGRALAPVRANPRWGLGPKLIQIDREQWRGVVI